VIGLVGGRIATKRRVERLKVEGGLVAGDPRRDIAKVAVVERHRATGNIGLGFVRGFGIRKGAIASSVGHDAHNITVVGADERDMAVAVNEIARVGGGQVAARGGKILARVELPITGLMSDKPAETVAIQLENLHRATKSLGVKLKSPFMQLAFLPLAVIPELRITDKGLVDVERQKIVSLLVR
jgi:adenine deaminase